MVDNPPPQQPEAISREEIARIVDPEAWEEYLLEDGRVDQEVASIFQEAYEASLAKADAILAKMGGGDQGSARADLSRASSSPTQRSAGGEGQ